MQFIILPLTVILWNTSRYVLGTIHNAMNDEPGVSSYCLHQLHTYIMLSSAHHGASTRPIFLLHRVGKYKGPPVSKYDCWYINLLRELKLR